MDSGAIPSGLQFDVEASESVRRHTFSTRPQVRPLPSQPTRPDSTPGVTPPPSPAEIRLTTCQPPFRSPETRLIALPV